LCSPKKDYSKKKKKKSKENIGRRKLGETMTMEAEKLKKKMETMEAGKLKKKMEKRRV